MRHIHTFTQTQSHASKSKSHQTAKQILLKLRRETANGLRNKPQCKPAPTQVFVSSPQAHGYSRREFLDDQYNRITMRSDKKK